MTFSIEVCISRSWYFNWVFKDFLHILLIGTTTPRKIYCQGIEPSVYEVNTDANNNEMSYIRI